MKAVALKVFIAASAAFAAYYLYFLCSVFYYERGRFLVSCDLFILAVSSFVAGAGLNYCGPHLLVFSTG